MRFTESHEWVQVEGNVGTVGITEYAQSELGEIVSIELPKVGLSVRGKSEVCVLESTKSAADVYTPISGKVIAINEKLKEDPSLINKSAESAGWLFKVELSDLKEVARLLSLEEYHALIN